MGFLVFTSYGYGAFVLTTFSNLVHITVMSYSGYDIEDAVILNKASIDRGFGRCMVLKKYQTSVRKYANGAMDRTCGKIL